VPQLEHTRCGKRGCPQRGQALRDGVASASCARRMSRRERVVLRFGTAISDLLA
jgi:hypothetical protein